MDYWRYVATRAALDSAEYLRRHVTLQIVATVVLTGLIFVVLGETSIGNIWRMLAAPLCAYFVLCLATYFTRLVLIPIDIHRQQVRIIRTLERQLSTTESASIPQREITDQRQADVGRRASR